MFEHENLDRIDIKVVNHAYERSGLTPSQLAYNLDWNHSITGKPDATRVKRVMARKKVSYRMAVNIVEACHFDPVDYGL